ncbi:MULTISPECIES: hypothetical protein [Streptomyces]|uniref:hypothetical protein n=1 Tax=Streptomyces TaxID=1883 RepID=UPI0029B27CB4|nr:hypothetical protein [Streptomyces sp. ME02-6979.5a]MDX3336852.1 hypothetical protein [Streptomyces sp. ME02-6979.5a]
MSRADQGTGRRVDFPPVENGVDYLRSVVEHLTSDASDGPSPRNLKYAVLHLQAAVEVLLKARLQKEHWSLVLDRNDGATRQKFDDNSFKSCTSTEAVRRLTAMVGVEIGKDDRTAMEDLGKDRNALQHYGLSVNAQTVESRAAIVLDFLLRFMEKEFHAELDQDENTSVSADMQYVRQGLTKIRALLRIRMEQLAPQLEPLRDRTVECPECRFMAYVARADEAPSCLLCQREAPLETDGAGKWWRDTYSAAIEYAEKVLGTPWKETPGRPDDPFSMPLQPPLERCPGCNSQLLVLGARTALDPDLEVAFCFGCTRQYAQCEQCHMPIDPEGYPYAPPHDTEKLCRPCFQWKLDYMGAI